MEQQVDTSPYLPTHIANFFLWKAGEENIGDITPMKLIKLVYIAYAWYLAIFDKKLFGEQVQAWRHGPVIPSIYHEFKTFGYMPISKYAIEYSLEEGEKSYPIVRGDDDKTIKLLEAVWAVYKNKSGIELSKITHEEHSPWHQAYYECGENALMDNDLIKKRAEEAIQKYTTNV
jgi:uncharacterized phage-associated protein